jgi:hypothetical protein
MQFLHSKWVVYACWLVAGAITAAINTPGLLSAEALPYATAAAGFIAAAPVKFGLGK